MDVLAEVLGGVRARGALFRQLLMSPPWSLRFATGAPLTLSTMLRGAAWVLPAAGAPVRVRERDVVITRGPAPYTVADDPATRPRYLVTDADYCARADGTDAGDEVERRLRTCDMGPGGAALLLAGAVERRGEIGDRLLAALPGVLVVAAADVRLPALDLLAEEVTRDGPGQQAVLDRLLDLTLTSALRAWFGRAGADRPDWYAAGDDPVVGRALRLLHADPARPWTLAELAAGAGVSRAALGRRFTARVGEPPMRYLTGHRIALAADLLRDTDATVGAIARRVGYANAFALSVAFKRRHGVAPSAHRAGHEIPAAGPAAGVSRRGGS
ncbi:AraC family transcriptional regulator [Streptomyces johnsoniae]